jgi:uncharacterized protein
MTKNDSKAISTLWCDGDKVPMAVIRRFARMVAMRFKPDKIILFGSHVYGVSNKYSDVDILVIMATSNQLDQTVKIELACDPPFPLDIIVRTPRSLKWRLAEGESFLSEILAKGKVLYEKDDARMGEKGGRRATEPRLFDSSRGWNSLSRR